MTRLRPITWLLLLPAALILGLMMAGVSAMVAVSFGSDEGWLGHYERFVSDPTYLAYVWRSFRVALWTTAVTMILGYAVAYVMSRTTPGWRRLITLVLVLQFFSVNVTRIYSLILILGNNGVINRALRDAGLIEAPIRMIYNELGVTIGLVSAALPFAAFPIVTVLDRIPPSLREMALTLGAGRTRIFWLLILPLSAPGVLAGVTIVFLYSLAAFATPLLLGGGFVDLISVFAYEQAINLNAYGFAAAGALVTLFLAFLTVYAANRLAERWMRLA
ncbi:MAG TPA: ABC transporter permease [Nordella sp.]|nr:ABC transporter permease [Nordella sp.]